MDNYEIATQRAQAYFLKFDQSSVIRRWSLEHDDRFLYTDFLGRRYAVDRADGSVTRCFDGKAAGHPEVLSIFDLLCHQSGQAVVSGSFAPVNSLRGAPKAGGVGTDFYGKTAQRFDRDPAGLHRACRALGGVPQDMGDIGYRFPVFDGLQVILKFYHSDEDFPAGITLLWDMNTLQFIHYETVFYIAGFLLSTIGAHMACAQ